MTNSSEHAHGASQEENYLALFVGLLISGIGVVHIVFALYGEEIIRILDGVTVKVSIDRTTSDMFHGLMMLGLGALVIIAGQIEVHLRRLWR